MRLLAVSGDGNLSLTTFLGSNIPSYAILSHTWEEDSEELLFQDVVNGTGRSKAGYKKVQFCGEQAKKDDLRYFWVDSSCIDRSNSTELSEAINSMFRWYRNAAKCYVYLSDVSRSAIIEQFETPSWISHFQTSRWFTRGWTLQELIAPALVDFYSLEWTHLGDKKSLEREIHRITGIPPQALQGRLAQFDISERFSWAANRETTREEDRAYSLFGIFDLCIPLLYGEGVENAFHRLREEIAKRALSNGQDAPYSFDSHALNSAMESTIAQMLGAKTDLACFATDLDFIPLRHLEFNQENKIPLQEGRLLGQGRNGSVVEAKWPGALIVVAIKKRNIENANMSDLLRRIKLLKRLRHPHVVRVVCSYSVGNILGLMLWPVAICNLGALVEDVDYKTSYEWNQTRIDFLNAPSGLTLRWMALGLDRPTYDEWIPAAQLLYKSFGCLVKGIAYLHSHGIVHGNLKPSNVLIAPHGLRLTDIGTISDLPNLGNIQNEVENLEHTRYYAPELSQFRTPEYHANMFSLGCIFMEMTISYSMTSSLCDLRRLCSAGDRSFRANLERRRDWFTLKRAHSAREQGLLQQIAMLLSLEPNQRPSASRLQLALMNLESLPQDWHYEPLPLFGSCCKDA